ncbi:MAG: GNAT family N-acetyltransferase [Cyanobacteria bacterium REEB67]|nr:GNAT family N-acetyltransferase [Cyanobacteria bacterium REEB67]
MLTIERLTAPYRTIEVQVLANQDEFVGKVDEILANLEKSTIPFVVRSDGQDVGFFTLTPSLHDPVEQLRSNNRCTLKSFMIDARYQGKGFAATVLKMLPDLVPDVFGADLSVGLTVNCRNTQAYKLYEKNGFRDTGELYSGGSAGPQHIMMMDVTLEV